MVSTVHLPIMTSHLGDGPASETPFDALYDHLSTRRDGSHLDRMARHVLTHQAGRITLLGIDATGAWAIYHDALADAVYAVPFSAYGLHAVRRVRWPSRVRDPRRWVRSHSGWLSWLNGRR